ncbi:unnamed protein product [Vitrella brassicaformis CCMP3155]|uniref:Uncharacterized protein n=2 Tax=Vitrella brassicaformis TaxID=1169539 RepID=A0A0G4ED03_VITBC|nr:unnamed protein product [Vitrella brassicaformis CCMP3155]|mmetsp:Transcript_53913/g.135490  ORF Transcript_53913/g.135490 Transcript_53913/m.135490 type:complete len:432 (+) Transcript_53913:145-1440(+)|eukprot:CEL93875.1 unnamed protein product [Vitrella brassicaformis CCMP3155]
MRGILDVLPPQMLAQITPLLRTLLNDATEMLMGEEPQHHTVEADLWDDAYTQRLLRDCLCSIGYEPWGEAASQPGSDPSHLVLTKLDYRFVDAQRAIDEKASLHNYPVEPSRSTTQVTPALSVDMQQPPNDPMDDQVDQAEMTAGLQPEMGTTEEDQQGEGAGNGAAAGDGLVHDTEPVEDENANATRHWVCNSGGKAYREEPASMRVLHAALFKLLLGNVEGRIKWRKRELVAQHHLHQGVAQYRFHVNTRIRFSKRKKKRGRWGWTVLVQHRDTQGLSEFSLDTPDSITREDLQSALSEVEALMAMPACHEWLEGIIYFESRGSSSNTAILLQRHNIVNAPGEWVKQETVLATGNFDRLDRLVQVLQGCGIRDLHKKRRPIERSPSPPSKRPAQEAEAAAPVAGAESGAAASIKVEDEHDCEHEMTNGA